MRILAKCGTLERRRATRKKRCASDLCENAAPKRLSDAAECAGKHPKQIETVNKNKRIVASFFLTLRRIPLIIALAERPCRRTPPRSIWTSISASLAEPGQSRSHRALRPRRRARFSSKRPVSGHSAPARDRIAVLFPLRQLLALLGKKRGKKVWKTVDIPWICTVLRIDAPGEIWYNSRRVQVTVWMSVPGLPFCHLMIIKNETGAKKWLNTVKPSLPR